MQPKDFIGLAAIPFAILGATLAASCSRRARDLAFFLLVAGAPLCTVLDINFLSREWYRGTTRGFEFSFVDVLAFGLLFSSLLVPRPGHRRFYWPASLGLLLVFLLYCAFSIAISEPRIFGLFELSKMIRALVCFAAAALVVQGERELRLLLAALACAVFFEGALGFKQRYLDGVYRVGGTLDHPNSLSMYLLLTAPVLVAAVNARLPAWLRVGAAAAVAAATVGEILTASRLGIPAFALVVTGAALATMSWRITPQKIAMSLVIFVAVAGMTYKARDIVISRYLEASLEEEYGAEATENRGNYLYLARDIMNERFLGVGLNNWSYWVSKRYGPARGHKYEDYDDLPESLLASPESFDWSYKYAPPAHNLAAIIGGELGVPGLLLFGALWLRWFVTAGRFLWPPLPDPLRRIPVGIWFGLGGVFLQSITEWVFRQTSVMLTLHLLIGTLAGLAMMRRREQRRQRVGEVPRETRGAERGRTAVSSVGV